MLTDINLKIPAWLFALFAILFLLITCDGQRKLSIANKQIKNNYSILQDSIKVFRDKNNKLTYKVGTLEANDYRQLLEIQSEKTTVKLLQSEVQLYKGKLLNSTAFSGQTKFDTVIKTEIKFLLDTFYVNGDTVVIPKLVQSVHHNDKWININIESDSLNTSFSVKTFDEYTVSLVKNKRKWDALIKSSSPYSSVSEITTALINPPKPKRFGIGVHIGYGINSSLQLNPYLGIGVSYNVIRF